MVNVAGWPVMKRMCKTCMFGPNGDQDIKRSVEQRTIMQCSQICHELDFHLCRGQRNVHLLILYRLNLLSSPSDEAFEREAKRRLNGTQKSQTGNPSRESPQEDLEN